jgi:hypothetical protein
MGKSCVAENHLVSCFIKYTLEAHNNDSVIYREGQKNTSKFQGDLDQRNSYHHLTVDNWIATI